MKIGHIRYGLAVLLTLLLCACRSAPVHVDASARVPDRVLSKKSRADACGFAVGSFSDRRPGNTSVIGNRVVVVEGIEDRVRTRLAAHGVTDSGSRPLDIELMSAYGYTKWRSMTFTTVLRVQIGAAQSVARGTHTSANWVGGNIEISQGLLRSVDAATKKLVELLAEACSSRAAE